MEIVPECSLRPLMLCEPPLKLNGLCNDQNKMPDHEGDGRPLQPLPGDALRVAGRTPDFTFTALVAGSIVIVRTINGFLIQ